MDRLHRPFLFHFCCSAAEWEALHELARRDERKRSEAMRELIRAEAARRGMWPPPGEKQEAPHG